MKFNPFDYQVGMAEHLEKRTHGALFAGMGLGKTVTTLQAYSNMILDGRMRGVLIIAPIRVCNTTWPVQIAQWDHSSFLKVADLKTDEGIEAWENGSADIYLINPERIASKEIKGKKYKGFFEKYIGKNMPVDTLLIDELSLFKANSKRTKTIIKYRNHFDRIHGLTGTPSPNGVMDLFFQLLILDGGERLGKYITHFRDRWFDSDYMGYNYTPKSFAEEQIHKKISDICLIRRSEDHINIPQVEVADIDVKLPAKTIKIYSEMKRNMLAEINGEVITATSASWIINKLQQVTSGIIYDDAGEEVELHTAKLDAVGKLLKKHSKEPILIITRYRSEMAAILKKYTEVEKFDEKKMDAWQRGKIRAWVANPQSISHGVDGIQNSCRVVLWVSLTYSLESYLQTCARVCRTGQNKESIIYRLLVPDSVDWAVLSAIENKTRGQNELMEAVKLLQKKIN